MYLSKIGLQIISRVILLEIVLTYDLLLIYIYITNYILLYFSGESWPQSFFYV